MKRFTKFISLFVVICIVIGSFSVYSFALNDENILSSNEFLDMAGKLVSDYDTPFYLPESTTEVVFEKSNRLIVRTVTNEVLTDDRNAVAKVEGWNSMHILQYESEQDTKDALEFFSNQPFVEYVEEDQYIEIFPCSNTDGIYSQEPLSWGNSVVKSDSINKAILNSDIESSEIVVGIFDTGINVDHKYFLNSGRVEEGYNVFDQNSNITDTQGHGSHVAGIILNNTLSNVKVKMYKLNSVLFISNTTAVSLFATAVISAVDDGIDVINMSLSLNVRSEYIDDAFDYAYVNNVPIVVAAGNDSQGEGYNIDSTYLASKTTVIAVSAIDESLKPMRKSKNGEVSTNYGECVDIAAPGESINSVNFLSGFMEASGTSMATPFVTAVVATLKSVKPNISCEEVIGLVKEKATIPSKWNSLYGVGILNVENMLSDVFSVSPEITFDSNFNVTITSISNKAIIYYTTDNTDPIIGESNIYTTPIDTSNATGIRAIACEEGKLPSAISTLNISWSEDIQIRYGGRKTIDLLGEVERYNCTNEEIVSFDGTQIKGNSIGKASVVIFYKTGQRVVYNVTVKFADWQWIHKVFYEWFGILLWSF